MVVHNRMYTDCIDLHILRRQNDALRKRNRELIDALVHGSSDKDQQLQLSLTAEHCGSSVFNRIF